MDGSVMGDDVFDFLFDKHPIDKKKEFAIVVNITPQTSTEERKKQEKMADFKTTLNNAERVAIVKSDLKPVKDPEPVQHPVQEEPLDLRVVKRKEESPEKRAKSNQVCFLMKYNFSATLLCSNLKLVFLKTDTLFLITMLSSFLLIERRWTFEEEKKKITKYKPRW